MKGWFAFHRMFFENGVSYGVIWVKFMNKPVGFEGAQIGLLSPEELALFEESLARAIESKDFLDIFYE
ncbi:MAG: hypothetical protein OQL16_12160, partial [Gammaproteobacteria bacterium]|nr:hypothetical protein [Gammaproteobacteria bacterium]